MGTPTGTDTVINGGDTTAATATAEDTVTAINGLPGHCQSAVGVKLHEKPKRLCFGFSFVSGQGEGTSGGEHCSKGARHRDFTEWVSRMVN